MPCDAKFGKISQKLRTYDSINSPAQLMEYIKTTQHPICNVFPLKREEIQNINVLTIKDLTKRVALIRSAGGKAFQSASVIVLIPSFPDGYLLKNNFDDTDDDATKIDVNLPGAAEGSLNLGTITFEPRYPQQRKLAPAKLEDLKKMKDSLLSQGDWIEELIQSQVNARDYDDDDPHDTAFPPDTVGKDNSLEINKPVRIMDPSPEAENESGEQ